ncbi:MAG: hypothetical protein KDI61_01170 [Alphaproteobacteria bacterium]|nr:hypothetical protein [Alphaproteobacteria bacterium]
MTKLPTKIRLKVGAIEVEYEGDIAELKEHLPDLLETVTGIDVPENVQPAETAGMSAPNVVSMQGKHKMEGTTNSIASAIGCKSGPDLIKAASLQLTLVQGKEKFTRRELIAEMKTSTYHKETYIRNLGSYLKTLFKDFLNESSKDTFSIKPAALEQYRSQLAAA